MPKEKRKKKRLTKPQLKSIARNEDFMPFLNKVFVEETSQSAFQIVGWTGAQLIATPVKCKNEPIEEKYPLPKNTPVWERQSCFDIYLRVKDDMPVYYRRAMRLVKDGEMFPEPNIFAVP